MKKTNYILLIFLLAITTIKSQSAFASQNASATAYLVVPLSITSTLGDLDFGEVLLSNSDMKVRVKPFDGKLFVVNGHPNRVVTFTFNSVVMDNANWAASTGGVVGQLNFTPIIRLDDRTRVRNGDTHTLPLKNGVGELDVWVGGTIKISANQATGDYTGRFTLSVSY
jgi:hypothetical protein